MESSYGLEGLGLGLTFGRLWPPGVQSETPFLARQLPMPKLSELNLALLKLKI